MSWRIGYERFWNAVASLGSHPGLVPTDCGRNGGYLKHPFRAGILVYITFNDTDPTDEARRDLVVQFYDGDRARNRYMGLERQLRDDSQMSAMRIDVAASKTNVWVAKLTVERGVPLDDLVDQSACAGLARRALSQFDRCLRY